MEPMIADGAYTFYLGGYGAFDSLAAAVLLRSNVAADWKPCLYPPPDASE